MASKWATVLLVLVILAVSSSTASPQGDTGIIPPDAPYRGHTYGEWGAKFWQSLFALPVVDGVHPFLNAGAFGGGDGVVFLSPIYFPVMGTPGIVEITVPAGMALFVPVINAECSVVEPPPFHGDDEASLRACANDLIDHTSGRFAVLDGNPVTDLDDYRVESPLFTFGPLPENNLLQFVGYDAPAGTTSPAVDAGVYLLLAPLSGEHHTLHVGGTYESLGVSLDTTFLITVVPEPGLVAMLIGLSVSGGLFGMRRLRKNYRC